MTEKEFLAYLLGILRQPQKSIKVSGVLYLGYKEQIIKEIDQHIFNILDRESDK